MIAEVDADTSIRQESLVSETERALGALWSEVLQTALPSATDDFFALGGDSMTMVVLEFRIAEEFGVQLPPGTVLGATTVRELAALIDSHCR